MILQSKNKINPNFNMSSMTDVVFLLVIFFMLTSTLVTVDNALNIDIPTSSSEPLKKQVLSISITKNKQHYLNDVLCDDLNTLELQLQEQISTIETPEVILRADKNIPVKYAIEVIEIVSRNKCKIVLATSPRE
tara:strand:+ start:39 stop:440 length:402 start_codon:yes stop_codon:yes gene_type:complete